MVVGADNSEFAHNWRIYALCAEYAEITDNFDLWFQEEDTYDSKDATDICFECPVRQECLKFSKEMKLEYGIFGGIPSSLRLRQPLPILSIMENPYATKDKRSQYHESKLRE